jgi:predicted nucleic acid-binding protein
VIVDASVWVSSLITDDVHYAESRAWLESMTEDGRPMAIPSLALAEFAGAVARVSGRAELGERAAADVLENPALRIVTVDLSLARLAAGLASRLRLRGADAVYLATARAFEMPLVTWDEEMHERASGVVAVLYPT